MPIRYSYYAWFDEVSYKESEHHDLPRGIKIGRESNGYCPVCGHWSIRTNIKNAETEQVSDLCTVCQTLFEASKLKFIDSKICTCGHPKNFHENNALSCVKGKKMNGCQCEKYQPTSVTIEEHT